MLNWRDVDEAPVTAIELPAKPPKVRKKAGPGANVGNVRFCVIPIRAVAAGEPTDLVVLPVRVMRAHEADRLVLAVAEAHPEADRSQEARVFGALREIEALGLVKRVKSRSKGPKHARRRYGIYDEDAPLPQDEVEIVSDFAPFPFNDDAGFRKGGAPMMTIDQRRQYTANQIGQAKQRGDRAGLRRDAAAVRIDDHVRKTRSRLFGLRTAPGASVPTARKWISKAANWPRSPEAFLDEARAAELTLWLDQHLDETVRAACAHIDKLYAQMVGNPASAVPMSIAQIDPPDWVKR